MSILTYGESVKQAMSMAMERDESVFLMGIGVDDHKAIFGSAKGLVDKFGHERVFDTPIAEAGMTGVAIGAALAGMKPVHIHIRADFLYLTLDQLFNIAAKWSYMFGGKMSVPIVVRAVIGRSWGQGAQHSQSPQAIIAHVPGLKVVMPTTAYDVKGLLLKAIADPNPVVMIEHRLLYDIKGEVPDSYYEVEFGKGVCRRSGKDLTIVATSYMVPEAIKAAEFLSAHGIDLEIIDPLTLVPLDEEIIFNSVHKTGRLLVADTGWTNCGFSAEISARVSEKKFTSLKGPIKRLGTAATVCPVSKSLENLFYPNAKTIVHEVCEMLGKQIPNVEVPLLENRFKGPF